MISRPSNWRRPACRPRTSLRWRCGHGDRSAAAPFNESHHLTMIRLAARGGMITRRARCYPPRSAVMRCRIGRCGRTPPTPLDQPLRELYAALDSGDAGRTTNAVPAALRRAGTCGGPGVRPGDRAEGFGRAAVGQSWMPRVRARLLRCYRRFTVATYVANFDRYDGERFPDSAWFA